MLRNLTKKIEKYAFKSHDFSNFKYILFVDNRVGSSVNQIRVLFNNKSIIKSEILVLWRIYKSNYIAFKNGMNELDVYNCEFFSYENIPVFKKKIFLYMFNSVNNNYLIAQRNNHHIFIQHGDSFKPSSYKPLYRIYDYVALPNIQSFERIKTAGILNSSYIDDGRLIITDIFTPQIERIGHSAPSEEGYLLYAPTWEGVDATDNCSSVGVKATAKILQHLAKAYGGGNILVKIHPNSHFKNPGFAERLKTLCASLSGGGVNVETYNTTQETPYPIALAVCDLSAMELSFNEIGLPCIILKTTNWPSSMYESKYHRAIFDLTQEAENNEEWGVKLYEDAVLARDEYQKWKNNQFDDYPNYSKSIKFVNNMMELENALPFID